MLPRHPCQPPSQRQKGWSIALRRCTQYDPFLPPPPLTLTLVSRVLICAPRPADGTAAPKPPNRATGAPILGSGIAIAGCGLRHAAHGKVAHRGGGCPAGGSRRGSHRLGPREVNDLPRGRVARPEQLGRRGLKCSWRVGFMPAARPRNRERVRRPLFLARLSLAPRENTASAHRQAPHPHRESETPSPPTHCDIHYTAHRGESTPIHPPPTHPCPPTHTRAVPEEHRPSAHWHSLHGGGTALCLLAVAAIPSPSQPHPLAACPGRPPPDGMFCYGMFLLITPTDSVRNQNRHTAPVPDPPPPPLYRRGEGARLTPTVLA